MKNFIIILLAATAILSGCNGRKAAAAAAPEHEHEAHENTGTAVLTAAQMKSIQIELGHLEKKQLTASLKANGILKVPNQNRATATALMGGVVKSILVQTGNFVKKGQPIATISNTTFIALQEDYLSVASRTGQAELDYKRQQELQAGNANAMKTLQQADTDLKILKARKASLQKQLELIGINTNNLSSDNMQSSVNISSPISGSVSNVTVNIGSYVDANTTIAEVIDNSQLHLDLYVYEKDLSKLKVGQTIHFTLTNNPGKEYDADVYAVSNTFEPNTKALSVHAAVKGDKTGLIDGMSITALVSLENATVEAVPTRAIVSYQGQDYIFVVHEEGEEAGHHETNTAVKEGEHTHAETEPAPSSGAMEFERIPVRKGTTDIGYSEITILKDIPAHARIVTNGAFFILAKMTNQGEAHEH